MFGSKGRKIVNVFLHMLNTLQQNKKKKKKKKSLKRVKIYTAVLHLTKFTIISS